MKTLGVCAVIALLASCTTVTEVKGPDARPAYVVECHSHEAECYQKASEVCPKGYSMVSNKVGTTIVPLATGGSVGAAEHSLVIQCTDQAAPTGCSPTNLAGCTGG